MAAAIEVCILAGGLSSRMGRAKAQVRLGSRTLLGHVRHNAAGLGLPVRIIRRDLVTRCGPLGGIYSALKTTEKDAVVFLPCDMPFLSVHALRRCLLAFDGERPVFAGTRRRPGFPIILPRSLLGFVREQIRARKLAVQDLARDAVCRMVRVPADQAFNVNTADDLAEARRRMVR